MMASRTKEARRMAASEATRKQLVTRVPMETYYALQLAHPFVRRDSMQDLVAGIIDDFLDNLRTTDPGFQKALIGFKESQARKEGTLSRRSVDRSDSAG
jgi:hypothetical protein